MLRIGICDDDENARDSLYFLLERLVHRKENDLKIEIFPDGNSLLKHLGTAEGSLDLLFLDIEMPGLSGMETARALRRFNQTLLLVFVTGYADYVFDGYSVGALDYLLKPVNEKQLDRVLQRALAKLHLEAPETFTIKNAEGFFRIPKTDIVYVSSDRRKLLLYTRSGEYAFYGKLDAAAADLGSSFIRIHNRYLVNSAAVAQVSDGEVRLERQAGPVSLPISRAYRQEAMLAFVKAMFR